MDTLECNYFWDHSLYLSHSLSMCSPAGIHGAGGHCSWRDHPSEGPGHCFTSHAWIWAPGWLHPGGQGMFPCSFAHHLDFIFSRTLRQRRSQSLQRCDSTGKKVFPVRAIFKNLRKTPISLPSVQCRLGRRPHLLFCLWALCMKKGFFFYYWTYLQNMHILCCMDFSF